MKQSRKLMKLSYMAHELWLTSLIDGRTHRVTVVHIPKVSLLLAAFSTDRAIRIQSPISSFFQIHALVLLLVYKLKVYYVKGEKRRQALNIKRDTFHNV